MKTKRKWSRLSGALLCGTMLTGLLSMTAFAKETGVAINETNFPDGNFRRIVESYDIDGDEILSGSEIEAVTDIDCDVKWISSLKGIEHFTALKSLSCFNNQLSSLDVSQNTALENLRCSMNQLSSLDVSQNTALVELNCSENQLTRLDVSQNTALEELSCYKNQLTNLDVSQNTALVELFCSTNQLSELNVSQNTALVGLYCSNDQLSSLDVSRNIALKYLVCCENQLTSLDVSKNTALKRLSCYNNQLRELDLSQNTVLVELDCINNQLNSLDVSQNTALEYLACNNNRLSSLDMSQNTALRLWHCDHNQYMIEVTEDRIFDLSTLPGFDISKASDWQGGTVDGTLLRVNDGTQTVTYYYDCGKDHVMFSLKLMTPGVEIDKTNFPDDNFREIVKSYDIDGDNVLNDSEIAAVWSIDCVKKEISSLKGIEHFTVLEELYCSNNQLSSLDVSQNTKLCFLQCYNNQLSSLDVSQNTALAELFCYGNQLSSLDVSKNTALKSLHCYNIQLSSLDVSQNTALEYLNCSNNQLSSLDVSKNTALDCLLCSNNQLSSLDVSKNIALERLYCENNQLSSLDVSQNTALESLSCYNNQLSSLDVSKNIALERLSCENNQLSSLDVSQNTALESLNCSSNQLSSLDVSQNTALEWLSCSYNQLTSLDVSKNTLLEYLSCGYNQYMIEVPANRTYDLSALPGFDVNKASYWWGGTVDGNQLHINKDVKTVTYYYDCGNNRSAKFILEVEVLPHTCVFDQKTIVDEALKTPADCTHDAIYYMSCECGEISTSDEDTFVAEGTALGHDYATAWSSDKTNHWHECSRCRDKKDDAAHTLKTYVTPATMTKAGKAVTKCTICEKVTNTKTIAAIKTVKLSKTSYVYDGKTKTPGLTVKDSAGKAVSSKYYKVEKSSGRKNVGKYTYKITFKGNYKGTKTLSFVINPKGTELISLQAESKGFTARWKKQATQTTGYEIRYATNSKMNGAKTVKITKNSKVSQKITKLTAKKKYYVQIRTYKKINTATYKSAWSKTKTVTTRK